MKSAQEHAKEFADMREGWQKEIKKSEKWEEDVAYAKKGLAKLVSEEDREAILSPENFLTDYPPFIRLLAKAGRIISEDGGVGSEGRTSSAPKQTDVASILYPNMK